MSICASKLTKNVAMPKIDERAMEAVRLPCRTWLLFPDWHMWLLLRRRSLVCVHEVWRGGEDKTIERAENQMACAKSCKCEAQGLGDCFYLCLFFSYYKVMNGPCKKKKIWKLEKTRKEKGKTFPKISLPRNGCYSHYGLFPSSFSPRISLCS